MFKTSVLTAITAPLALTACVAVVPPPATMPDDQPGLPGPEACGAERYAQYIGQQSPTISVPAGTVYRVIGPNDAVTMDLMPARVNFIYDDRGVLEKVECY